MSLDLTIQVASGPLPMVLCGLGNVNCCLCNSGTRNICGSLFPAATDPLLISQLPWSRERVYACVMFITIREILRLTSYPSTRISQGMSNTFSLQSFLLYRRSWKKRTEHYFSVMISTVIKKWQPEVNRKFATLFTHSEAFGMGSDSAPWQWLLADCSVIRKSVILVH